MYIFLISLYNGSCSNLSSTLLGTECFCSDISVLWSFSPKGGAKLCFYQEKHTVDCIYPCVLQTNHSNAKYFSRIAQTLLREHIFFFYLKASCFAFSPLSIFHPISTYYQQYVRFLFRLLCLLFHGHDCRNLCSTKSAVALLLLLHKSKAFPSFLKRLVMLQMLRCVSCCDGECGEFGDHLFTPARLFNMPKHKSLKCHSEHKCVFAFYKPPGVQRCFQMPLIALIMIITFIYKALITSPCKVFSKQLPLLNEACYTQES